MRPGRLLLPVFALAVALPAPVLAWGELGHRMVATIAFAEVRPETRRAIKKLLRHGAEVATPTCPLRTLEDAAVWPDCLRGLGDRFASSFPWHYQDISVCMDFDVKEACPDGNCVTAQIAKQAKILATKSRPIVERITALAFLAHFVGDVHQPLHVGEKGDRGGNQVPADYGAKAGGKLNLHHIWDTELAERALTEPPVVGPASVTAAERVEWRKGNVTDWARESWQAAKDVTYGNLHDYPDRCLLPPAPVTSATSLAPAEAAVADSLGAVAAAVAGPRAKVDEAYIAAATPVVRTQIEKAGVRLAMMLDAALTKPLR
ncbi:S1/P1 nuclease [Sphingosinicellaceae bacterium]|nr:S1/P1 nuclease [Sphingosinicellaceae bacterium]